MSRLPIAAFAALVAATVGAFFVTQHLKVTTPLIAGASLSPAAINPVAGTTCGAVNHRRTRISFYLQHRADDVDVYVIDQTGTIVATLVTGRHMARGPGAARTFVWNGRKDDGSFAPNGSYYVEVALIHQGRTVEISDAAGPKPISVVTVPPHPIVTAVTPPLVPRGAVQKVSIRYAGNGKRSGTIRIYRSDLGGPPHLINSFVTPWAAHSVVWNGLIDRQAAPAGIYLIGLDVTDAACNTGHFPYLMPPPLGTTPGAGVTVRYLAAEPSMAPVVAGSRTTVYVDARQRRYRWSLWRSGARKPAARGAGVGFALPLRLPGPGAGLYELDLNSGTHATSVPIVASAQQGHPKVLVVLPSLTWQGLNPVDGDQDGLPDTLAAGQQISLQRPLEHGLPAGVLDEAGLLASLDKARQSYDLTTDLGLIDGVGPPVAGHAAVVLAGQERWIPDSLRSQLRTYVERGGHVLSLGIDSLLRGVTVRGRTASGPGGAAATDPFGARVGPLASQRASDLITVIKDGLGIFSGTSGALPGFTSYQSIPSVASPARVLSQAGATASAPSIVAFRLGQGIVVDIGLPGFGSSLARNVNAQELLGRVWAVLSR